ncbi:glutathione S-transferase family protein [Thermaurantiacus sp.]
MTLYGTDPSFYTRKAWLSLTAVGADFAYQLKTHANKAAVEAAVNGYHRFPVLDPGDGSAWIVDSTRIGLALSQRFPARSLLPDDPALAILVRIADDWMDEWFLRAAILFRAKSEATRHFVARVGALNLMGYHEGTAITADEEALVARALPGIDRFFLDSCATNGVVGCGIAATEALLARAAALLGSALAPFLFGSRLSLADAALWGFLDSGLLWEPEARAWVDAHAPHLVEWHARALDQARTGGGEWAHLETAAARLAPLLGGDALGFSPFLAANRAALEDGTRRLLVAGVEVPARGFTEKCRAGIAREIAALAPADRARLEAAAGDWPLLAVYREP